MYLLDTLIKQGTPLSKTSKQEKTREYLFKYKGKWVIDSRSSLERFKLTDNNTKQLLKKATKWLIKEKTENKKYLFYSSKLNQAVVVEYRADKKENGGDNHLVLVDTLPPAKKIINSNVETYTDMITSQDFVNYIDNISQGDLQNQVIKEGEKEVKISGANNLRFYFVSNKVWNIVGYNLVELI